MLNEAQQPYNYLIESIRARDTQNQTLSEQLALMEEETRSVIFNNYFLLSNNINMFTIRELTRFEKVINNKYSFCHFDKVCVKPSGPYSRSLSD